MSSPGWPQSVELVTPRLVLVPLRVDHAESMVAVLADPSLYDVTGGQVPTLHELRERYRLQVNGQSPDGAQGWLNWIVTETASGLPIGFVQATVAVTGDVTTADVAWVIAATRQGNGFATEAARALVDFLDGRVDVVTAHVAPGHVASERVASRAGLCPTAVRVDGETRWERRGDMGDL